jgi:glycosyltransferase involved in cell wall biosynthesis
MKLSVIVPMYNEEKYILHCLKSLSDQNISKNDYEIIVVDDGSTDESLSIVKKYSEKIKSTNIFVHSKKNGGLSDARNFGQELVKGKYI